MKIGGEAIMKRRRMCWVLGVSIILVAGSALADKTWTGATDGDFENGGNWGGTAPADDLTELAIFSGSNPNQPILTTSRSIKGLRFNSTSRTILDDPANPPSPYTLTIGGSGIYNNSSGGDVTVGPDAVLSISSSQTPVETRTGYLTIRARITGTGGVRFWGIDGEGNQDPFHVYGDNDYSGSTLLSRSTTVYVYHPNAFGTTAGDVVLNGWSGYRDEAILRLHGNAAPNGLNANKHVRLDGDGELYVGGGITLANDVAVSGARNVLGSYASGAAYMTGTITVPDGVSLTISRYNTSGGTLRLNYNGSTVVGKITGGGSLNHSYSGSTHNRDLYIYGNNDYTGGTTMGVDYGCDNDIRVYSDTAFGLGPVYLQSSSTRPTFMLGASVTMPNDFRGVNGCTMNASTRTFTTTGAVRPGDTGLGATPTKNVGTFNIDGKLKFGSDTDGCTYYWHYNETSNDRIVPDTLELGSGGNVVECEWLGAGDPPTPPKSGTSYVLFTYTGTDPADVSWTVVPPNPLFTGVVSVDGANNRVLLTLYPPVPSTVIKVQ